MAQLPLGDRAPPKRWQSNASPHSPNANWGPAHRKHNRNNRATVMALLPESAAFSAPQLEGIADAINDELGNLHALFKTEFLPRALNIGQLLAAAKAITGSAAPLYRWAEERTGLRDRSVRNYLQLHANRDALQRLITGTDHPPTSIDGCLALLRADANAGPDTQPTEEQQIRNGVRSSATTLKSAVTRAHERIAELDPQFLSADEVAVLEQAIRIADRAAVYANDPSTVPARTHGHTNSFWQHLNSLRAVKTCAVVTAAERQQIEQLWSTWAALLERFDERLSGNEPTEVAATATATVIETPEPESHPAEGVTEFREVLPADHGFDEPRAPEATAALADAIERWSTAATTTTLGGLDGELPTGVSLSDWSPEQLAAGLAQHNGNRSKFAASVINPATSKPFSKQLMSTVLKRWEGQGYEFPRTRAATAS